MDIKLLEKPESTPVSLPEMKEHLRVLENDEDQLIEAYMRAATEYCETIENKHYLTTKIKLLLDEIEQVIRLPRPPLQSLEKIEYQKVDGTIEVLDPDNYVVDESGYFGYVRLINGLPSGLADKNKLQITYTAGYKESDDVPYKVKSAIKFLTAHYWSQRTPVSTTGGIPQEINLTVKSLLNIDRVVPV